MKQAFFNRIDPLDCVAGGGIVASVIAIASTVGSHSGFLAALSLAVLLAGVVAGGAWKFLGNKVGDDEAGDDEAGDDDIDPVDEQAPGDKVDGDSVTVFPAREMATAVAD